MVSNALSLGNCNVSLYFLAGTRARVLVAPAQYNKQVVGSGVEFAYDRTDSRGCGKTSVRMK